MFHRKKGEGNGPNEASGPEAGGSAAAKPMANPPTAQGSSLSPKAPASAKPYITSTRRIADIPGMGPRQPEVGTYAGVEDKTLVVGRDICLNGQIMACDKLVVEGNVEADLTESRVIEIAKDGTFKGSAEVDEAEIGGRFEGNLTARKRLVVRASGKVEGKIAYGWLEIEAGGEISGDVKVIPRPEDDAERRGTTEETATPEGESRKGTASLSSPDA